MTTPPLYNYIENTGTIVADTSNILTEVQTEYQDQFGSDLVVTPDTPQGVLINAEALSRAAVAANNASLANQINPNIAGGVFLDSLLALTGMQRTAQTQTQVTNVTLTGVASTVVPAGSLAATSAGDQFASQETVTLSSGGTATINFASVAFGAIPCASGDLSVIVSNILGWETVTNNGSGSPASVTTLGSVTQSDQAARALRQNTLAFQGVALPVAITSALYNVPGVTSLWFQENTSATTQTINTISMVPHSIYVSIAGGSETAIAAALLENKSSGCAWNGGTSVTVVEPASGQSYTVLFDIPAKIGILIQVTTTNGNEANIIQAILDYAAGNINGLAGFVVGANVSPFEIAGAIMSEFPAYYIQQVEISLTSPVSYTTNPITINPNQIAVTQASYVSVIIS